VLPRPLAGGQWWEGLDRPVCSFLIRLLVTHARQVSLQCGSGTFSSTNVDPLWISQEFKPLLTGSLLGGPGASRDARALERWDLGPPRSGFRRTPSLLREAWPTSGPDRRGQASKGTGGMPRRHQMVGVEGRDRSGGAAQRASIPEFSLDTRGTETSQYPQEKKSTETPSVAASERGSA
jgi:hypothetical protein